MRWWVAALVTLLGEPKVRGTWREQVEEKPVVPKQPEEQLGGILRANGRDVAVVWANVRNPVRQTSQVS
jgi:hypothetical protein